MLTAKKKVKYQMKFNVDSRNIECRLQKKK